WQSEQRKLRRQRKNEKRRADDFCNRRGHFFAAQPLRGQNEKPKREEKCSVAESLKEKVGNVRADRPNPVLRGPAKWRGRGDIERRVLRRVRKQAQRQQNA